MGFLQRNRTAIAVIAVILALVGCFALLLSRPAAAQKGKVLVIKGSDTMVVLSQAWAEAFMAANPGSFVSVTGGGSGTGMAALLNGTCDIANSSRPMSLRESEQSKQRNLRLYIAPCALDGLAIAVHTSNPIQNITLQELAGIFTGKITDWSQLKLPAGRIVALSRESNSGTHVYFKERVLKNAPYGSSALFLPSTKSIQQEISNNRFAIGYGGEAYFKNKPNVKLLAVAPKRGMPPIFPTNTNVSNGTYPIARELYMFTPGRNNKLVTDFINFCRSPRGQEIVVRIGYVPMTFK